MAKLELLVFLDRAFARLRRDLIRLLLIDQGNTSELLRNELPRNIDFRIVDITSDFSNVILPSAPGFLGDSHAFNPKYLIEIQKVFADTKTGMLFNKSGGIIPDSSTWSSHQLLLNSVPHPVFSIPHKISNLGFNDVLLPSNGFYHWLIEDLPSCLSAISYLAKPRLLVYEKAPTYVLDALSMLKIPYKLCPRFIEIDSLFFVSKGNDTGWPSPPDLELLRNFAGISTEQNETIFNRKVFVPRLGFKRSEDFEIQLCKQLAAEGWEIYRPESQTLQQQIEYFWNVKVLSGFHGAGFSGMVWMPKHSKIIELMPSRNVQCYRRMASVLGNHYTEIPYEGLAKNPFQYDDEFISNLSKEIQKTALE
jgi:hypothetical protein